MNRYIINLFLLLATVNFAQELELPQITPLSPNAASIAKYGEIPVGHFTGTPNINIPLYTIQSNELTLPLSLNYHGGGNKVEAIASWVGLGWSLNTIPSISRTVRGIPDEGTGGFFSKYQGKTIEEHFEIDDNLPDYQVPLNSFRTALFNGEVDSEPDIFYYSLAGESGKFFYNQESEEFITLPKSNIKIIREGSNYRLTTENGIEYVFDVKETTRSSGASVSERVTSNWYASKIISATKKDSITLDYKIENQRYRTKTVVTKYQFLGGGSAEEPDDEGSINTINLISARLISQINFKNGYIQFNRNTSERNDLEGGYSLDNISIYNTNNKLINKYKFHYKYLGSGSNYETSWMLLDRLDNISVDLADKQSHNFSYNQSSPPPSRNSAAQDYWGYYNEKTSNANLIPKTFVPNANPPQEIAGADRSVNPIKSKFAILKKISYPTGGYTEFDFENHIVNDNGTSSSPPTRYKGTIESIEGEGTLETPASRFYEKTFTINNPPDPFLNNRNPDGGANVNFYREVSTCPESQIETSCAIFKVIALPPNDPIIYPIPNSRSLFLPNGNYKLTVKLDLDILQDVEFSYAATWDIIDDTPLNNNFNTRYAGGLRVKEIRSFASSTSQPIVKRYKYTTDYETTESSGDVFSEPNFSYEDIVYVYNSVNNQVATYLRMRSTSNTQQINHSGSFVGYKTVIEETDNTNKTGYTQYKFSHVRDISSGNFPHPPAQNNELYRGQLLEEINFRKSGNNSYPVRKRILEYTSTPFHHNNLHPGYTFAIKWGNNNIGNGFSYAQVLEEYEVNGGWSDLSKETIENYTGNRLTNTQVTHHYYDNSNHLYKTRTEVLDSDKDLIISKIKYPQDITNPTTAITALINQNRLGIPLETEIYKDNDNDQIPESSELINKQKTNYKVWHPNVNKPESILVHKRNSTAENRIIYHEYDDLGNTLDVSRANGSHIAYIWGYNDMYPIAKIENATYTQVSSFVANLKTKSNADNDRTIGNTGKEGALRQDLQALRIALPNALVTTYTYDPLIGVTSMTDPRGYTMYYHYDPFNRLEFVKDADGNLVSENKYNYKN